MALFPGGEFEIAAGEIISAEHAARIAQHFVIHLCAAFGDQTFGFLAAGGEAGAHEKLRRADPAGEVFG